MTALFLVSNRKRVINKRANRDKSAILYPSCSAEQWAKIHRLSIRGRECVNCGLYQIADIPIASKGFRGFYAKVHACGERYRLAVLVHSCPKERLAMFQMANALTGYLGGDKSKKPWLRLL